ncbi:MAG TPA: signal recognition particle protein [Candidatus Acidoferrales bacterium]|nr:signal recognition particle protein [Candidatus Acidoferrales bacterium]
MFENLTEKLQRTFKNLRGQGKLTEEHLDTALGEIRDSLLDADVNVGVADEFIGHVRDKAVGSEVLLQLSPEQQVVKIVRDELADLLGREARPQFSSRPPSVWLIVGLQGSGKTTSTGKLGKWLAEHGHRPIVVSTDVYRPAAREQLAQVAKATSTPCWPGAGADKPLDIVRGATREAKLSAYDVILVDTAGRLHIDDELMNELSTLKKELNPAEILFVADAMIGQDAVRSAGEFHKRLGVSGVILTKLDGDARGGAALSIRKVTGAPVKFVGVGEKYDALEPFYPDRIVGRILGMGDVMGLIEKAEKTIDAKKARDLERKLREDDFTLEDFRDQLQQIKKMGSIEQIMGMLPKIGPFAKLPKDVNVDEGRIKGIEAIINSMTSAERLNHNLIDGKRRKRIARGSGRSVQEVNEVLRQYGDMRRMMKQYGSLAKAGRLKRFGKLGGGLGGGLPS